MPKSPFHCDNLELVVVINFNNPLTPSVHTCQVHPPSIPFPIICSFIYTGNKHLSNTGNLDGAYTVKGKCPSRHSNALLANPSGVYSKGSV